MFYRIHELQEDIIKLKLDVTTSQDCINHLKSQVRKAGFDYVQGFHKSLISLKVYELKKKEEFRVLEKVLKTAIKDTHP